MTAGNSTRSATVARVGRNSIWLLLARVLGQVLGLVFALLVARSLGEVILGQFAFISTVVLLANMATNLGTDTLIIRSVAAERDHPIDPPPGALLNAALVIQVGLSAVAVAAVWLLGGVLPNQTPETLPAFRLLALSLLPIALSGVLSAAMRGREQMGLFLIMSLIVSAALVLGAWLVVATSGGLLGLARASLVAQGLGALAAVVLFRRLAPPLPWRPALPSRRLVGAVARTGVVLALAMTLTLLIGRLGTLALSVLAGDAATGYFTAAARLVDGLKLLPAAVLGALFPVLARRHAHQAVKPSVLDLPPVLRRLLLWGVGLAAVLALLVTLLAGPLITLLYGPAYQPSVGVLRVLAWALPFAVVALSLSLWLVAAGQERLVVVALLPTAVVSAVVMAALIGRYGLLGAAVGSVAAEALQMLALLATMRLAAPRGVPA